MYRLQVFDGEVEQNRWRDVDCILEDECGALYAFVDSRPLRCVDVEDAKEVADAVAANTGARVGVFDEELGARVYDTQAQDFAPEPTDFLMARWQLPLFDAR